MLCQQIVMLSGGTLSCFFKGPGDYRVEEGRCCIMEEKYFTTFFHWIKT